MWSARTGQIESRSDRSAGRSVSRCLFRNAQMPAGPGRPAGSLHRWRDGSGYTRWRPVWRITSGTTAVAGRQQPVDQLCTSLVATASDFSDGELADDVTVLALRDSRRNLPPKSCRLPACTSSMSTRIPRTVQFSVRCSHAVMICSRGWAERLFNSPHTRSRCPSSLSGTNG